MHLKQAQFIVGKLSEPSKMPCYGFSIPASTCKVGRKLQKVAGSVCSKCYALKGNYQWPIIRQALARRFRQLTHPQWVEAFIVLLRKFEKSGYFRWHDSGDLQSVAHLKRIVKVCQSTPDIKHWIPTREYHIVSTYIKQGGKIPDNLTVRLSAYMIDGPPPTSLAQTLGVQTSGVSVAGYTCPANNQGNKCLDCRACWDKAIETVTYKRH